MHSIAAAMLGLILLVLMLIKFACLTTRPIHKLIREREGKKVNDRDASDLNAHHGMQ
jgi:hypothetical protein